MFKTTIIFLCLAVSTHAKIHNNHPRNIEWRQIGMRMNISKEIFIPIDDEVVPHSIPFQVSLQFKGINFHFCGGAVVNQKFVVTAAHCCDQQNAGELHVVAGDHNLKIDEGTEQVRNVKNIIIYPTYVPATISDDICLLELDEALEINEYVAPAALPIEGEEFEGIATVSGWGAFSSGRPALATTSDALQAVQVSIMTDDECRDAYGPILIFDTMMCAGGDGRAWCSGVSGGPLVCAPLGYSGPLCGIASWGIGCGVIGNPDVYTQTSYYVNWIEDIVAKTS